MTIKRIESVTYGVADMAKGIRFFDDIGLQKIDEGARGASFRTPVNQFVHLRDIGDASLPKVPESGPTMREVVWGVDSKASLDAVGAELSRDRDVKATPDGTLHAHDESGFAIGFAVSNPEDAKIEPHAQNGFGRTNRINRRFEKIPKPQPLRLAHVVYLVRPEGGEKACAFYMDRLGFKLTDAAGHLGKFMRVPGLSDHHSLLMMWIRKIPVNFDHIAFEMKGFDDVMSAGPYMKEHGWEATWGPGRQPLGCHMFWHFANPCGGEVEFFTDMDRFDDSWEPVTWKGSPGSPWTLDDQIPKMEKQALNAAKP
jgi:catechol 2,3-dioxygenase-like lactoylglutathione lyase family enzyme